MGSILLMLPFSSVDRIPTPFHEALFTATSAVCVTGLVVKDTGSYWSLAGQTIILVLIQIGGLGVVTVAASVSLLSGKKISLMQRSTMQDAISAPKVGGIVRLTRFILKGTFLIEAAGAVSVSYTHLDVYKRQADHNVALQNTSGIQSSLIFGNHKEIQTYKNQWQYPENIPGLG